MTHSSPEIALADRIADHVSTLANTKMQMSLVIWDRISRDFLEAVNLLRTPAQPALRHHANETLEEQEYLLANAAPPQGVLAPFIAELARQERVRTYRDGDCILADCRITIGDMRRLVNALSRPPCTSTEKIEGDQS